MGVKIIRGGAASNRPHPAPARPVDQGLANRIRQRAIDEGDRLAAKAQQVVEDYESNLGKVNDPKLRASAKMR